VAPNNALARAAADYAVLLMQYSSLSHTAAGTTLTGRVRAAGYTAGPPLGEVLWLAVGVVPPERTVADWMASPGHRDVILSSSYSVAGAACYFRQGARWEARCVMDFGG
jgi:uncharacterized protein YkwD